MKLLKPLGPIHRQWLANLVDTYGKDRIHHAVDRVKKRKRGRPSEGGEPIHKLMGWHRKIEISRKRHRAAGHKNALKLAFLDDYQLVSDAHDSVIAYLATAKKRRQKALKQLAI